MSKQKVLLFLKEAEGTYVSGERISEKLGICRAAVWKDIESLRRDGYEIHSVTGRGYQLAGSPNLLTEGEILPYLDSQYAREHLICLEQVDSTNTYAKKLALEGGADRTAIVANEQTGGRGRLGRSFQSPRDAGIYLTMLYRPDILPGAEVSSLTSYVAVAICEGIEAACGVLPGIKWTNDIILGGKKLAGILTEMSVEGETGHLQYLVTGIGINVCQRREDFPRELQDIATSLAIETGKEVPRGRLAAALINSLERMYQTWLGDGGDYWERYRRNCLTLGKEVRLLRRGGEERAVAEGIDRDFGLIVRHPDGRRETVTSGEVSVRGLCGYL